MKVLLYSLIFPPDTCSNSFVFADLAKGLIEAGDQVVVVTTTPHYDEEHALKKKNQLEIGAKKWYRKSIYKGASVFHIDVATTKGGTLQRLITFFRFHHFAKSILRIEKIEADVVIAQTPPMTIGLDTIALANKLKASSVLVLQDLWLDAMVDSGKIKGPLKQLLRFVEKWEYRKINTVTTIDKSMALRIEEISGVKPQIIPNFVDTELFYPISPKKSIYIKYGMDESDFIISYVGNIGEAQDLEPLLSYAKYNPKVKILIAGNGVKENYYRSMAVQNKLNNVLFLGYVTREEAAEINAISTICSVMLAKHVFATSFPSKIYSIMAMARPIFICCMPDNSAGRFVEENKIGWHASTVNLQQVNKMFDYISLHREECVERGKNGYNLIKRDYALENIVNRYRAIYRK